MASPTRLRVPSASTFPPPASAESRVREMELPESANSPATLVNAIGGARTTRRAVATGAFPARVGRPFSILPRPQVHVGDPGEDQAEVLEEGPRDLVVDPPRSTRSPRDGVLERESLAGEEQARLAPRHPKIRDREPPFLQRPRAGRFVRDLEAPHRAANATDRPLPPQSREFGAGALKLARDRDPKVRILKAQRLQIRSLKAEPNGRRGVEELWRKL